jgi:hypothetical protein
MSSSDTSVSIAALALAATTVAGLVWVVKFFAKELSKDLREHTKAAMQQQDASLKSAQASERLRETVEKVGKNAEEQYQFMKNLNGKLAKATIQTVQEQTVEHQTVKHKE